MDQVAFGLFDWMDRGIANLLGCDFLDHRADRCPY